MYRNPPHASRPLSPDHHIFESHAAARMTEEEIAKVRTGEHPNDVELEDFIHLTVPVLEIPRPTGRFFCGV